MSSSAGEEFVPHNEATNAALTDLYQITMAYAYFKSGRHTKMCTFDLFFRKNPFKGEYTVFAGLDEALRLIDSFGFTEAQVAYIKTLLPDADPAYFEYLSTVDCSEVTVLAVAEGTIVFPRTPLLRLQGPLAVVQLLETTLLNIVNYASLMATNASRFAVAAGPEASLLEFGLRRAQGPDGALSASRYAYLGGFHGTSNVLSGMTFDMMVKGTHAHSYVSSFPADEDVSEMCFLRPASDPDGAPVNLWDRCSELRTEMALEHTNTGELKSFVVYACAFPSGFLALVDTYDTLASGVPNYLVVARALHALGYQSRGIRLDSGDLAALSKATRAAFVDAAATYGIPHLANGTIVASNDINEPALLALADAGHEINVFGVGTHLVTCQAQPALGCVFKLVEIDGQARIKLSQQIGKMTVPGAKMVYRLADASGKPIADLMTMDSEVVEGLSEVVGRDPRDEAVRVRCRPASITPLLEVCYEHGAVAPAFADTSLDTARDRCAAQRALFAAQVLSRGAEAYPLFLSEGLFAFMRELWMEESVLPVLQ